MNAKVEQRARRIVALQGVMGRLLDFDVHPDVCRLFSPRTFDAWHYRATVAYMEDRRTVIPPSLGQLIGSRHWGVDHLLPWFIAWVILEHPDLEPRDHLLGGYFAVTLAPWLREDLRAMMAGQADLVVQMTASSELADRIEDKGRAILAAYDRALSKVAAVREQHGAAEEEGAE